MRRPPAPRAHRRGPGGSRSAPPAPDLDPRIQQLPSTTFFGRRLTRRQIAAIQETVALLPRLSRTELSHTICEHLHWHTPRGRNRIQLAMRLLEQLERLGILTLPARQSAGRGRQRPLQPGPRSAPQPAVEGPLACLLPLRLRLVRDRQQAAAWNGWIERYHPLRYRQPFCAHLRYFLEDRDRRLLGCLLYDFAALHLPVRDRWIGWQDQPHRRRLDRLVRQARFLLLPWVRVQCLASKALALSLRQLADNWLHIPWIQQLKSSAGRAVRRPPCRKIHPGAAWTPRGGPHRSRGSKRTNRSCEPVGPATTPTPFSRCGLPCSAVTGASLSSARASMASRPLPHSRSWSASYGDTADSFSIQG